MRSPRRRAQRTTLVVAVSTALVFSFSPSTLRADPQPPAPADEPKARAADTAPSDATTGVLTVRASAAAAEVLVDGKLMGVAPLELDVPTGTHRITVRHPDFRVYETSAVVSADGSTAVTATLAQRSVVTRWWFWAGVGTVVAVGAAVTIAAFTERAPHAGTIAPGQLTTEAIGGGGATLFRF
ncbi:PEGA domain-containing protein [Polyangium sp. y55x31]|uniref:PEGA domain-containing protein n=1 Tax=Polyangium sp. y55x31 TaxID=3042688 RepID=UPI002482C989|nr:PEGA domain-containing protein [Polyangium sp. y55x31]MDI1483386.1 PEGA domain-containing protein [Polyangium sp. y55x31]